MEKKKVELIGLYKPIPIADSCMAILQEAKGNRKILVRIGLFETEAILMTLEGIKPNRPLVYDLFKNIFTLGKINIEEIIICKLVRGIYYSTLTLSTREKMVKMDIRVCDAIVLSLKYNVPIYALEPVIKKGGIDTEKIQNEIETSMVKQKKPAPNDISQLKLNSLKDLLKKAIDKEDYELAGKIRDEIIKRNISDSAAK